MKKYFPARQRLKDKFMTCKLLIYTAILLLNGCSVLPKNGISYFGEDQVFSKSFLGYNLQYRQAIGREPGWELGISFIAKREGRIKGIQVKNPVEGRVPLTVWDATDRHIIYQAQVNLDGSNSFNRIYLENPIPVEAGKKYCVTINVDRYYYYTLPFSQLPLETNDIVLTGSVYEETYYPRYPQNEITDVLHGLIDLDMQWKIN